MSSRLLHPLPENTLIRSAFFLAITIATLLTGCRVDTGAKSEPVDPALKNVLSDAYCTTQATVSLICAKIPDFSTAASYRLQVSTDAEFKQLLVDEELARANVSYPSKWTGSHYWRILQTGANAKVLVSKKAELVNFYNDDDGDGLSNGLEMNGLLEWDLPKLGLNYQRKDIVVYMDTMSTDYVPSDEGFQTIINVFKNGPVANPNGETGINLVLLKGATIPFDANLNPIRVEFAALKKTHFPKALQGIAHYMIWAHAHSNSTSSGYSFGIPANDFVVTLGAWQSHGSEKAKIGTFIHELGHNLGLRHGGKTDQIYSPNYLSVMNYDFQVTGVMKDGAYLFDYQRINTEPLQEGNLNELLGIGTEAVENKYGTVYRCTKSDGFRYKVTLWDLSQGIDWNCDQVYATGVSAGIISEGQAAKTLVAQNDWANLNLAFIRASSEGGVSHTLPAPKELTLEQYRADQKLKGSAPR